MVFMNDDSARPISKKYTFTELFKDESQDHVIRKLCDPVLDAVKNQGYLIHNFRKRWSDIHLWSDEFRKDPHSFRKR